MLAARALRLSLGPLGRITTAPNLPDAREAIARAVGVVECITGMPSRSQLANIGPVHVHAPTTIGATINVARVSGLRSSQLAYLEPVIHDTRSITMFLARGDCYQVRIHTRAVTGTTFVSLDYGLAPNLSANDTPVPQRSPVDSMAPELNGTRLLDIAFDRELTPIEEYVAATTMPNVWARFGGRPVRAVGTPTPEDIEIAHAFCQRFSNPSGRIAAVCAQAAGWAQAFDEWERKHLSQNPPIRSTHDQREVEVYAAPLSEKNDKQEKQPKAATRAMSLREMTEADSPVDAASFHPSYESDTSRLETLPSDPDTANGDEQTEATVDFKEKAHAWATPS